MNLAEVAQVLAKAAAFDRRTVGEADVMAWWEAINDLDVADALVAVTRWYRDRPDWLMPSHLREAVRLVEADRAKAERLAQAEAMAESAILPAQRPAGGPFAELPPDVQADLSEASRGLLRAVLDERFSEPPRPAPSVLDVYARPRQEGER